MTNDGHVDHRPGKNERRAAAREKARQLREQQRKRDRRNRMLVQGGIGIGIVAVLAVIAVIIVSSIRPPEPGPKNMASDGILIGENLKAKPSGSVEPGAKPVANKPDPSAGVVNIVTYVDYLCPFCGQFERTNADQIGKLVDSGAATVEIHPLPFLASHSAGTKYSLRATNAAACVANYEPDSFWAFNRELFEHQPSEEGPGLTDAQIKGYVKSARVNALGSVDGCIDDARFDTWAQNALDRALAGPIPNSDVSKLKGTPLVLVNGQEYKGKLTDASEFRAFVVKAQGDSYSTATATPAPGSATPTPTSTK
jgi:protein-disulfide isomerase